MTPEYIRNRDNLLRFIRKQNVMFEKGLDIESSNNKNKPIKSKSVKKYNWFKK
jgi:hypothetical protein